MCTHMLMPASPQVLSSEQGGILLNSKLLRQENFKERLGEYLEEARGLDWNLMCLASKRQNSSQGSVSLIPAHS